MTTHSQNVVNSSLKAASLNMMTQVFFRLITFIMNAYVLRHISPDILGVIYVRLNLLDDTIIFLSTEGFRLAGLGHKVEGGSLSRTVNLIWLSLPASMVWSTVMGLVWCHLLPLDPGHPMQSQYQVAVIIVSVSAVVQVMAETPLVLGQLMMLVRLRVVMNTVWMMTRVIVLCLAVRFSPDNVISYWSYGHALASLLYVFGYYFAFHVIIKTNKIDQKESLVNSIQTLAPSQPQQFSVDPAQWRVASSFIGQAVVKQILTDAEKYVMTFFSLLTLSEQGVFDVVSNLGSLAARFIFRPVEDSAYFFFSQLWVRGVSITDQKEENVSKVKLGLFRLLRMMSYMGLIIVLFGYSYSHMVLHIYGGHNLSDGLGPDLLRSQCFLILFLAVNGVSECFARAVMSEEEINEFTRTMTLLSVGYVFLTYTMTRMIGPVGMVTANCINMILRILCSFNVIKKTFQSEADDGPGSGLVPDTDILLLLLSAGATCFVSEMYLYAWSPLIHLMIGVVMTIIVTVAIVFKEEYVLQFIVEKFRQINGSTSNMESEEEFNDSMRTKQD